MHVFIYVPSICFESFSYCVYQGSFFSNHCQHFFVCSVQLIFSIILYDCTSKASGLSFVASFTRIAVHVSDPYSTSCTHYTTHVVFVIRFFRFLFGLVLPADLILSSLKK